jgi:tRNA (cmo5U34)-methyltransferase
LAITNEERFDAERAGRYDEWIRKTIPGYEALHDMAMFFIETGMEDAGRSRLLIVGSGTGMEISHFAERNPGWTFTGVDPSPEMNAIAASRFERLGVSDRADLHTGYTHELPQSEPFDAATLMLVMHFLPDDGAKLALLESIAERLKPGAPFILADLYADRSSPGFSRCIEAWRSRQSAAGMDGEDLEKMFDDVRENIHFVPEERIMALLERAGFVETSRIFTAMLFGGWVSRRG